MFYVWDILLPFGKAEATQSKHVLSMEKGTITRCEVSFPCGCCGLVFCHIDDALHQVYPKNPDNRLYGNGETLVSRDEYEIKEEPYQLEFYGWNTDDTYNHTVTVRIQLVPAKEILHRVVGEVMRITRLTKPT
jgi:hypothetical protein